MDTPTLRHVAKLARDVGEKSCKPRIASSLLDMEKYKWRGALMALETFADMLDEIADRSDAKSQDDAQSVVLTDA